MQRFNFQPASNTLPEEFWHFHHLETDVLDSGRRSSSFSSTTSNQSPKQPSQAQAQAAYPSRGQRVHWVDKWTSSLMLIGSDSIHQHPTSYTSGGNKGSEK